MYQLKIWSIYIGKEYALFVIDKLDKKTDQVKLRVSLYLISISNIDPCFDLF